MCYENSKCPHLTTNLSHIFTNNNNKKDMQPAWQCGISLRHEKPFREMVPLISQRTIRPATAVPRSQWWHSSELCLDSFLQAFRPAWIWKLQQPTNCTLCGSSVQRLLWWAVAFYYLPSLYTLHLYCTCAINEAFFLPALNTSSTSWQLLWGMESCWVFFFCSNPAQPKVPASRDPSRSNRPKQHQVSKDLHANSPASWEPKGVVNCPHSEHFLKFILFCSQKLFVPSCRNKWRV